MVTFLDVGLLNYFSVIFPVILVFAIVYAVLKQTKILEDNPVIIAIISIVIALITLLFEDVLNIIKFMTPWFVLLFVFLVLLLTIYKLLGATEEDLASVIRTDKPVQWAVFGTAIIIVFAAFASVMGQKVGPYLGGQQNTTEVATGSFQQNIFATLFHPKVLGLVVILAVAIFSIALLTTKETS